MNLSMWLTFVATVGIAILVVPVARARHHLTPPLLLLAVAMLVWNLSWLAHQRSGFAPWSWITIGAASAVPALGLDFVVAFVGKKRAWSRLRALVFCYFGVIAASSLSRFVFADGRCFMGTGGWRICSFAGSFVVAALAAHLLFRHYRRHADRAERAHTRLVVLGFLLWIALAGTDLLHRRVNAVPQMSALGMLVFVLLMTIVLQRMRPNGERSRWLLVYGLGFAATAVLGNYVIIKALGTSTAMVLARTAIFTIVILAAAREVMVILAQRRARVRELALIGRFTAQLAHDLKNPLAALRAAAQLLKAEGREPSFALVDLVEQQANRLASIIDEYERASRIEPCRERFEPARLVDQVIRPEPLGGRGIVLERSYEVGLPPVRGDQELLARALENLVDNAIEAMPSGGRLRIEVRRASPPSALWRQTPAAPIQIAVSDTGRGIDARTCERVFDDFFTTKAGGSGLGLAFVRRVAEAHGGSVRVESEVGRGTRVSMWLPAEELPIFRSEPIPQSKRGESCPASSKPCSSSTMMRPC